MTTQAYQAASATAIPAHPVSSPSAPASSFRAAWIDPEARYSQNDNLLISVAGKHIGVYGVAVFQALVSHADFATGESFPTIEMLMEELDISEPTACKYIALLEKCGMIFKRTTRWGTREQGPKSRNFYRILPASNWNFSSLENDVLSAPKQILSAPKQIGSNKKHQYKKNEVQKTTRPRERAKTKVVVVVSSQSENPARSTPSPLEKRLEQVGMNAEVARALVEKDAHECEFQLARLARETKPPKNAAGWLRRAIEERFRDSDAPRKSRETFVNRPYQDRGDMPTKTATPKTQKPAKNEAAEAAEATEAAMDTRANPERDKREPEPRAVWRVVAPETPSEQRPDAACDVVFASLPDDIQVHVIGETYKRVQGDGVATSAQRLELKRAFVWEHCRAQVELENRKLVAMQNPENSAFTGEPRREDLH